MATELDSVVLQRGAHAKSIGLDLFSGQWEGAGEAVGAEMGNDVLIQIWDNLQAAG